MDELQKVARVIAKRLPGAPHETLLVLDGTIGQNAVQQAKIFAAAVPVTGLVVTKLDGTARGGVVVAVHEAIDVPVKFLGVGEAAGGSRRLRPGGVRAGAAERGVTARRRARPQRRLSSTRRSRTSRASGRRRAEALRRARRDHGRRPAVPRAAPLRGREHRRRRIASLEPGDGRHGHRPRHLQGRASPRARACASSRPCCRTTAA